MREEECREAQLCRLVAMQPRLRGSCSSPRQSSPPPQPTSLHSVASSPQSDLLSGVLELDPEGRVVDTTDMPLYQPGLMLGLASERLVGLHVSDIIPAMAGRRVADLFLPQLGAGKDTGGRWQGHRG